MTDAEMLKLCGDAMGYQSCIRPDGTYGSHWNPLKNDAQAMALLRLMIAMNENERWEISNHVVYYQHRKFSYAQVGGFFKAEHLNRAIVECVAKRQKNSGRRTVADLIYLATPYSHPDRQVRCERAHQAAVLASRLTKQGYMIFCPIAHTHAIIECDAELRFGIEFWGRFDDQFLAIASALWVGTLDGWDESQGIKYEVKKMLYELHRPVSLIDPDTLALKPFEGYLNA